MVYLTIKLNVEIHFNDFSTDNFYLSFISGDLRAKKVKVNSLTLLLAAKSLIHLNHFIKVI